MSNPSSSPSNNNNNNSSSKSSNSDQQQQQQQLLQVLSHLSRQPSLSLPQVELLGKIAFGNATAKQIIAQQFPSLIHPKLIIDFYNNNNNNKNTSNNNNNKEDTNNTTNNNKNTSNNTTNNNNNNKTANNDNTLAVLKTLRACIVNCPSGRAVCREPLLFEKLVHDIQTLYDIQSQNINETTTTNTTTTTNNNNVDDDHPILPSTTMSPSVYLDVLQEYITTLCALCINDDINTQLLKAALVVIEESSPSSSTSSSSLLLQDVIRVATENITDNTTTTVEQQQQQQKQLQDIQQRVSFLQALML
ncbi:hypothetical protein IV203_034353 [Nitzschia inconspicua]|uniref:Uncharacterized protein n=1 Tax=Nitzschia inconspicua TaxID=303405 RepID=A0A9K3P8I9_9STRA|nr:hypothetical protein IV203_022825 [Nitzschia inconspicua]KAG7373629.1 hypothetical protein IV203_034353 [Nitzschia inconspicua]